MNPVGSLETAGVTDNSKVGSEHRDAAPAVAAHHAAGAVRIVKFHAKIGRVRRSQHHQAVGTESAVTVAQAADIILSQA